MMRFVFSGWRFCLGLLVLSGAFCAAAELSFHQKKVVAGLEPLMKEFCISCHSSEKQKGGLNLEELLQSGFQPQHGEQWETLVSYMEKREMPPENKPQPTDAQRSSIIHLSESVVAHLKSIVVENPGRVTVRRLNRDEYNNTIRDLVGVDFEPAADFPGDEVGYGFDNIGDVLSLSPLLLEKYLDAAEQIVDKALVKNYPPKPNKSRHEAEKMQRAGDSIRAEGSVLGLYRDGGGRDKIEIKKAGRYRIRVRASGDQAGLEPPKLGLRLDGKELKVYEVRNSRRQMKYFDHELKLEPGVKRIEVAYLNNYVNNDHPDPKLRGDRNLFVDYVDVIGPLDLPLPQLPKSHAMIIPKHPDRKSEKQVARKVLNRFASRAYRRPVEKRDVDRLMRLYNLMRHDGGNFQEGVGFAIQGILTSPHFLYRWELDPAVDGDSRTLQSYEIASRLSYFLWGSMPDDRLFELAKSGELNKPEVIEQEALRMLKNPKAQALVENFGGQWLQVRNLKEMAPDPEHFPAFNESLRADMLEETFRFMGEVMTKDLSLLALLDADFTFLNERLARHYGIPGVKGDEFRKVSLKPGSNRGGVLTQASVLTITSNPTRTSPVIRGKWILEQILGTPPPPPPPNVPELEEGDKVDQTASLRERLEVHRSNPDCAVCHNKLDPLGFALENYDAIGAWRDHEGRFPIDPSGELPGGDAFDGAGDLKKILKSREDFIRSFSRNLLTYALGRGLEYYDQSVVDEACKALKSNDHRFSSLITIIVTSRPFLNRNIETAAK